LRSGVDPANLERIFEAFHTTKPSGMGMGLSICRAIIEVNGGKLWATLGEPHGAIFQFALPPGAEGASQQGGRRQHHNIHDTIVQ
jgi:signal transduction histidine kinase